MLYVMHHGSMNAQYPVGKYKINYKMGPNPHPPFNYFNDVKILKDEVYNGNNYF